MRNGTAIPTEADGRARRRRIETAKVVHVRVATAPAVYARPPAASSATAAAPSACATCGIAATPTQPSAIPIAADSHFGACTQQNFARVATAAPPQTTPSTIRWRLPWRLSSPTGVYVPAIRR